MRGGCQAASSLRSGSARVNANSKSGACSPTRGTRPSSEKDSAPSLTRRSGLDGVVISRRLGLSGAGCGVIRSACAAVGGGDPVFHRGDRNEPCVPIEDVAKAFCPLLAAEIPVQRRLLSAAGREFLMSGLGSDFPCAHGASRAFGGMANRSHSVCFDDAADCLNQLAATAVPRLLNVRGRGPLR